MKPLDALEEVLADVRRGALSEEDALDRIGRLIDDPARDGRAEVWFHERTDDGWVIFDENRAIVATVPDTAHEREDDAIQIASAANRSNYHGQLRRAVKALEGRLVQEADSRRRVIRDLVERIASDLRVVQTELKERGPDYVTSVWLAGHVRELVEAQADLDTKRRELDAVARVLDPDA
ncbi:MAG: hypothetical protein IPJ77_19225 [Planctomycetes bacterium]|nr:hypothetical protein [Planctomycetota bacterium]